MVNLALDRQFGKATPLPPAPEKKEAKEASPAQSSSISRSPDDATHDEIALSERPMKKIEAVFQPFKLDEIREVLAKARLPRFSLLEVKGAGCHQIIINNTAALLKIPLKSALQWS